MVVVDNCGKLLAGLVLMPAARGDDGDRAGADPPLPWPPDSALLVRV